MNSTKNARGRKPVPFKSPWNNETIDGLHKCSDGRWKIIKTGQKYTERDPRLAVARFHRMTRKDDAVIVKGELATPAFPDSNPVHGIDWQAARDHEPQLVGKVKIDSGELWAWLREQVISRPKYVASMTGIEQIGYLAEIKPPPPSPTLDEICKLYHDKKKLSDNWAIKSQQFWREFCDFVQVQTIREITQEQIVDYYDMVMDMGQTPTYARQRFGQVKTVINFPPKRGKWAEDCARASALCKVLVKPRIAKADPHPIDRKDFAKLLDNADPYMHAVLLCMMNFCMYASEAAVIEWPDINMEKKTLVTDRPKTEVVRIGVIWDRTRNAIEALPRSTQSIFITEIGSQANYVNIYRMFKTLRATAKMPHVQLAHIRDGAYSAAIEAGIPHDHVKLLAGQKTGISDRYVKRRPMMVKDACRAIERYYFVK